MSAFLDRIKEISLKFECHEEEGGYVADCLELGTSSCGDTEDEAFDNLRDAVDLHIDSLDELGNLEAFLVERDVDFQVLDPVIGQKHEVKVDIEQSTSTTSQVELQDSSNLEWSIEPREVLTKNIPRIQHVLVMS